jgi:molybdopterin-guanine dinucleotide biosynthesis protein A
MPASTPDVAVLLLAGGRASRLPGKLARMAGSQPLLLHAYRNACALGWPVFVAGKGSLPAEIDAQLECPLLVDRWSGGGPARALLSACDAIRQPRILALAGDAPFAGPEALSAVAGAWRDGDEAVVPVHDGRCEPLAAVYARSALLRETFTFLRQANVAMHALIDRMKTRFIELPGSYFLNVNTPAELAALRGALR